MLLAIDTATRYLNLALHDGHTLLAEQAWRAGTQHNKLLAPSVAQVLRVCAVNTHDLQVIAVCKGPGSYTGLRIGVAFAKALATTRKLPLIGVPTLDFLAVAQKPADERTLLIPVVQAGRGRIIAAEYLYVYNRWVPRTDATITTWQALLADRDGPTIITGEVDADGRKQIAATAGVTLADSAVRLRRAGYLAQEAWRIYQDTSQDLNDFLPERLLPLYLKTEEPDKQNQTDGAT